ncbi:MAG: SDR family NAD(P)-dependent oxidoreductase [Rhodoferax sp.]
MTGASRGLGSRWRRAWPRPAPPSCWNGRDPATLEPRRAEIEAAGGRAAIAAFDVRDRAAGDAAIDAIEAQFGHLDILINNAAFGVGRDFFDITDEEAGVSMDVALDSCFRLSRKAAAKIWSNAAPGR